MGWMTRLGSILGGIGAFLLTYDPPGPEEHLGPPWKAIGTLLAGAAAILVPFGLRRADAKILNKLGATEEPAKKNK